MYQQPPCSRLSQWLLTCQEFGGTGVGWTLGIAEGLNLIRCSGHFDGGTVLHWAGGADGNGALLTGDTPSSSMFVVLSRLPRPKLPPFKLWPSTWSTTKERLTTTNDNCDGLTRDWRCAPGIGWAKIAVAKRHDAEHSMKRSSRFVVLTACLVAAFATSADAQKSPIVGLIPKAKRPIQMDGKLDDWGGAFVTPVHVGHPDFANRGGQFLFLWDDANLYIGLRCLDQKPAHIGTNNQIWNGDAVEFYLDTRRGDQLGAAQFDPGTLHSFWTPFTKTELKPRIQVRDLPVFKDFKLQGAEVAGAKTPWGYTAEFKLPWGNFVLPDANITSFHPKAGEVIGIDCELCSSDGGPRVDRTFVYSGPAAVGSPSAFGRVKLVDRVDQEDLKPFGRALLPLSLTKSTNYPWIYGTACISPTIEQAVAKIEGRVVHANGKVVATTEGSRQTLEGSGFVLWSGSWELFAVPPGTYSLELTAFDKTGKAITGRKVQLVHGMP